MKYRKPALFGAALVACVGFSTPAYAYLDGGTLTMIVQLAVGAAVGGLVAVKLYWYRLLNFFSKNKDEPGSPDQNEG
ncbi:MAG: hypothetical protein QF546_01480 [Alphaproteobacteria bacterium]|jgi:hypothetical protein|nr:hypothetical protein [Alphaproteobacteria bacterium]